MNKYYRIGATNTEPWEGIPLGIQQNLRSRVGDLKVGVGFWKSVDNRFYELGINPNMVGKRDITGVPAVDKVANMALDWVHIGMLGLSVITIRAALI